MDDVGIFYGHLVNLPPFGIHILRSFCIFYSRLVYFYRFGMLWQEKSGNPGRDENPCFKRCGKNAITLRRL
jgi:hypothetical protein